MTVTVEGVDRPTIAVPATEAIEYRDKTSMEQGRIGTRVCEPCPAYGAKGCSLWERGLRHHNLPCYVGETSVILFSEEHFAKFIAWKLRNQS